MSEDVIRYRRDLWKLIRGVLGDTAEIGVAEGYFSADMLDWPRTGKHYMVDRWTCVRSKKGDSSQPQDWHNKNFEAAKQRVKGFGDRAVMLRMDSEDASKFVSDCSLALLYIDGDHSYEGVMSDLRAWTPKIVSGGIIAFHDYLAPQYGVNRVVKEYSAMLRVPIYELEEDKSEDAGAYLRLC